MSIQCTTCGSRLRVRDPKLVGQIVACPKCQAMVLVAAAGTETVSTTSAAITTPPELGFTVGQDEIDSEALTQERIDSPEGLDPFSENLGPQVSGPATSGWLDDFGDLPVGGDHSNQQVSKSDGPPPTQPIPPGEPTALDGAVPPVAWQSESSAKMRQLAAVAAIAVIGLLVAGGLFALVIRSWKNSRDADTATLAIVDPKADASGENAAEQKPPIDDEMPPTQSTDPDRGSPDTTDPNASESVASPESDVAGTELDPALDITDAINQSQAPVPGDGAEENAVEPAGMPLPAPLFPEVRTDSIETDGESDAEGTAEQLPPSLAQYMEVIQLGKPDANVPGIPAPAPPAMEQLKIQFPEMVAPDTEYPPAAAPVDVRARGKMRILGFMAEDQPLDQILRVIGQAAGIPIELDLLAFDVAGMSVNQALKLKSQETEAAILLARIVQVAGCTMELGPDSIVRVSPRDASVEERVAAALRLDDFEGQPPLSESEIRKLTGAGNDTVITINAGNVVIDGPRNAKLLAALLLDSIRTAREMPTKLDATKTSRWIRVLASDKSENNGQDENDARQADWAPITDHEVGFREDQEYGTDLVLGDLAADLGAGLVIDWTSCWSHGLTPEAKSLPWFDGKKTHQVVEQVLSPYALKAFAPGENIVWVGTQEAYEKMPLFAVLHTRLSPEATVQRIAKAMDVPETETPAWIDPVSNKLVVFLPRYVIRELPATLLARQ